MTPELKELRNIKDSCINLVQKLNEKFANHTVYYFEMDSSVTVMTRRIKPDSVNIFINDDEEVKIQVDLINVDSDKLMSTGVYIERLKFSTEATFLEITKRSMAKVKKEFSKISNEEN